MKEILTQTEQDGKKRGMRVSIAFHTVILLLAFLLGCPSNPEEAQAKQYAVAVNFEKPIEFKPAPSSNSNKAKEKEGAMKKKADPVAKIDKKTERIEVKTPTPKPPTPKPPTPTPTPPVITPPIQAETTTVEEVEVVVTPPEADVVEVEVEVDDVPAPEVMDVPEPVKVIKKPSTKVNAGTANTSQSSEQSDTPNSAGNGSGSGKGDQGTGKGADPSGNDGDSGQGTGGTGLGEYDDSGNGIFGRRVTYRNIAPILKFASGKSGKIYFKVCINPKGQVNFAELNEMQTTITDRTTLKEAIKAIYGYKFEPDPRAADEECGKIVVNVENFNGIR